MRKLLAVIILFPSIVYGQTKTFVVVPFNFQDDTSQPRSIAQLSIDTNSLGNILLNNSYGVVKYTVTVKPYVTISINKTCNPNPALVEQALRATGDPGTGGFNYVYYVSPTTFGHCAEQDKYGLAVHVPLSGINQGTLFVWHLGLGLQTDWICKDSNGNYVPISNNCSPSPDTANARSFASFAGQGSGSLSAIERTYFGWLPQINQLRATDSGQWTVTPIEKTDTGIKRLILTAMNMEFEYHAPKTSQDYDNRGLTGYLLNTDARLDFTADGKFVGSATALEPNNPIIFNGWRFTVFTADLNQSIVNLSKATDPQPVYNWPTCPSTSPNPTVNVLNLIDSECANWKVDPNLRRVTRNGSDSAQLDTNAISYCDGMVYGKSGSWYRWGGAWIRMATPATPSCNPDGNPPPLPPPASIMLVVTGDTHTQYSVEAIPNSAGSMNVKFYVDSALFHTEGIPKYCLFGGDVTCTLSSLGKPGPHTIRADMIISGSVVATANIAITE
jgi:hypothetical protein